MSRSSLGILCVLVVGVVVVGCRESTRRPRTGDTGPVMGIDAGPRDGGPPPAVCDGSMGPENTAAACGDGCDNDGNGFADCNDFDCCGLVTCGPGTACEPMDGGATPCPTMGPENTAAACADGCDNDGNRFQDCNDFDCCGLVACGRGTACEGTLPPCETMGPENTAAACMNGCDDDGNGFGDCNDFDCCGLVACPADTACGGTLPPCPTMGPEDTAAACMNGCDDDHNGFGDCNDFDCCSVRTDCPADTACGMPRPGACDGGMTMENTAAACRDGCSNDGDMYVDCQDRDCCSVRRDCPAGTYCGDRPPPTDAGPCTAGMENTVVACSDGCSNDGDTFIDCNDFECCGVVACGAGTSCATSCVGPRVMENTLVTCSDGCSNDMDMFVDCDDRDCCTVRTDCPAGTACGM